MTFRTPEPRKHRTSPQAILHGDCMKNKRTGGGLKGRGVKNTITFLSAESQQDASNSLMSIKLQNCTWVPVVVRFNSESF